MPTMQKTCPGLIPGSGRSPGVGNGSPLQHSCLENPIGREATVHRVTKNWIRLSKQHFILLLEYNCFMTFVLVSAVQQSKSAIGIHICIYIHIYTYTYIYIYMYTYTHPSWMSLPTPHPTHLGHHSTDLSSLCLIYICHQCLDKNDV